MTAPAEGRPGPALSRRLLLFALVNSLLVPLVLLALPGHPGGSLLRETYTRLLQLHQESDSWGPMEQAFDLVERPQPAKTLYEKIFFGRRVKFQYPPSSLLPFWLMSRVLPREQWPAALNAVSLLFLAVSILTSAALLAFCLARLGEKAARTALLGIWLAVAFDPLVRAYSLGQIQAWVNGLFALALCCWIAGRPRAAGALTGLMCLIKPHYALFALWAALRRRWTFLSALVVTIALGGLASLALFGVENHRDYLDVVAFMSRRGEGYFPNQSLNGLLNRLLRNGNNLEWMGASFAPYHPWVFWPTLVSSALLVAAALAPPAPAQRGNAVDFSLLALTVTVASPIAWEHHYGILPPIYAATLAAVAVRRDLRCRGPAAAGGELRPDQQRPEHHQPASGHGLERPAVLSFLRRPATAVRAPPPAPPAGYRRRHRMTQAGLRPGAVTLVAFGASLALYLGIGQAFAPGRMFERADLALGTDVPRVIADLTRFEANHYRTKVHPIFVILLNPLGLAAQGAARSAAAGGAAAQCRRRRPGRGSLPPAASPAGRRGDAGDPVDVALCAVVEPALLRLGTRDVRVLRRQPAASVRAVRARRGDRLVLRGGRRRLLRDDAHQSGHRSLAARARRRLEPGPLADRPASGSLRGRGSEPDRGARHAAGALVPARKAVLRPDRAARRDAVRVPAREPLRAGPASRRPRGQRAGVQPRGPGLAVTKAGQRHPMTAFAPAALRPPGIAHAVLWGAALATAAGWAARERLYRQPAVQALLGSLGFHLVLHFFYGEILFLYSCHFTFAVIALAALALESRLASRGASAGWTVVALGGLVALQAANNAAFLYELHSIYR